MNNGQIFDTVNILIRKEKEGDTITPKDFSELLELCSLEKGNADYALFEQSRVISDSIRSLMKQVNVSLTAGVGNFITPITSASSIYWHETGVTTATAEVDILTINQFNTYKHSDLLAPTVQFPAAKIAGNSISVLPITISTVSFDYLEQPKTPFYDYYIDANDNYIYLAEGATYTLQTGESYTDKEDGSEHTIGWSIGSKPTQDSNNMSVEMSYPITERIQVVYLLLSKLGIILNKQDAVEYGLGKEQKEEAQ